MNGKTAGDFEDFEDLVVFVGSWNVNSLALVSLLCVVHGVVSTPVCLSYVDNTEISANEKFEERAAGC